MSNRDPAMVRSGYKRLDRDSYNTVDERLLAQLLARCSVTGLTIWEPAAGEGHLARALRAAGAKTVIESDIATGHDFFKLQAKSGAIEAIITNPPYGEKGKTLVAFIEHALRVLPDGWVVILCPWGFSACEGNSDGRRALLDHPRRYAMTEPRFRPRWIEGTTEQPRHAFCWNIWAPTGLGPPGGHPMLWR